VRRHISQLSPWSGSLAGIIQRGRGDATLPINTVYLKTPRRHRLDVCLRPASHAITGPEALKAAIDIYKAQGIKTIAWFVPKRSDIVTQVYMAEQVIDAGVAALYADIEPYDGFCHTDCAQLARDSGPGCAAERPNANLGVIYDPGQTIGGHRFVRLAAPRQHRPAMCYWASFVDQPPWNDPASCVKQAKTDLDRLAPGVALEYVPMLQGDAAADQ